MKISVFLSFLVLNTLAFSQDIQIQWGLQTRGTAGGMYTIVNDNFIDSQGNSYVVGRLVGTVDFDPSAANLILNSYSTGQGFFGKYDSNGNLVWMKLIGVGSTSGIKIRLDANNNIFILGEFNGSVDFDPSPLISGQTSLGGSDVFLSKYTNSGDYVWHKSFGGTVTDYAKGLELDASGNLLLLGEYSGTVDFDPSVATQSLTSVGYTDVFFLKLNSSGDLIWVKSIGGSDLDYGNDLKISSLGEVFVTGSFKGDFDADPSMGVFSFADSDYENAFMAKFDSNGSFGWAINISGDGYVNSGGLLTFDGQGNVVLCGKFSGIADFDPSVAINNLTSNGPNDAFIAKYSNSGNLVNSYALSGYSSENIRKIIYSDNEYYLFGDFHGDVDFDLNAGTNIITGSQDLFMAKYSNTMDLIWVQPILNYGNEFLVSANINTSTDELLLTGVFYGSGVGTSIDMDPTDGVFNMSAGGGNSRELFIVKYKECNVPPPTGNSTQYFCDFFGYLQDFDVVGTNIKWYDSPTNGNEVPFDYFVINGDVYYASQTVDGCVSEDRLEITFLNNDPIITGSVQNVSCNGYNNGEVNVNVSSPSGNPTYTYEWSPSGASTSNVQNLTPGNHLVTVTTNTGCSQTESFTVTEPSVIQADMNANPSFCSTICTGSLYCAPYGGTSSYTYQWNIPGGNQTSPYLDNMCPGIYEVLITDMNGCTATILGTVPPNVSEINSDLFLTNIAAVDQSSVSPSFSTYYNYSLPASITPHPSNPRNFVDPGKRARFKIESKNLKTNGQSVVSGICKVRSNNPYVTITDSSSALNNIGWGDSAWSADEFEINISPNTPPGTNLYIDFIIQENGTQYATTCIPIPITPLVYSPTTSVTIDDDNNPDSQGNDNNICEPGETIEFYPWLDNISTLNAEYVRGRFENLENHTFINIWNGVPGVGTTVYDATWWNYSFAQPQTINTSDVNTTPEYDFVFDYGNNTTVSDFNLYMVMAGGFNLFNSNALSLVQWSLPYTFNSTIAASVIDVKTDNDRLLVYPNPSTGIVYLQTMKQNENSTLKIFNTQGQLVFESSTFESYIDLSRQPKGIYTIQLKSKDIIYTEKVILN